MTINSVEEDPRAVGGLVLLHHLVVKDASGNAVDLCAPDAEGRSLGFPIPNGHGSFDLTFMIVSLSLVFGRQSWLCVRNDCLTDPIEICRRPGIRPAGNFGLQFLVVLSLDRIGDLAEGIDATGQFRG